MDAFLAEAYADSNFASVPPVIVPTTCDGYNLVSPVGSVNVFVVPEAAVTATLSIFRNGAFDCALIFVVVPFTVLLLTNQDYVLDPSATAATHTMATFVTLI